MPSSGLLRLVLFFLDQARWICVSSMMSSTGQVPIFCQVFGLIPHLQVYCITRRACLHAKRYHGVDILTRKNYTDPDIVPDTVLSSRVVSGAKLSNDPMLPEQPSIIVPQATNEPPSRNKNWRLFIASPQVCRRHAVCPGLVNLLSCTSC